MHVAQTLEATKKFLLPGAFPFSLGLLTIIIVVLYRIFDLPSPAALIAATEVLFENHGLVVLLVASFLEGLFMLSMYFPGSAIVVLSVLVMGNSSLDLLVIMLVAIVGFVLANIVNYLLGKHGYYKLLESLGGKNSVSSMQRRFEQSSTLAFSGAAFHPNFLAISFICAGISQHGLGRSLRESMLPLVFWVGLWTLLTKLFISQANLESSHAMLYFLGIFVVWGLGVCVHARIKKDVSRGQDLT